MVTMPNLGTSLRLVSISAHSLYLPTQNGEMVVSMEISMQSRVYIAIDSTFRHELLVHSPDDIGEHDCIQFVSDDTRKARGGNGLQETCIF